MKKRIICLILILIVALGGGIGAYIISESNKGPAVIEESEAKYKTTLKEIPSDGSLPTNHTSLDNIAYVLWKLQNTNEFEAITTGTSEASVATIDIYTKRVVKDNKALLSTISEGMVSSGKQKYFLDNKVLLRDADRINGFDTIWKQDQPECISNSAYIKRYGWMPYQATGYIICEETILEISELKINDDNTYTISMSLNPGEDYAPFWYRREVLTNANSTIVPQFYSILIDYTFDGNWTLLESHVQEEYKVKAMGIEAVSKTNCVEKFSYSNVEFAENDYNFFKQYESLQPVDGDDEVVMEDDVITMITSSLQNTDGTDKNLNLTININGNVINAIASLNISDLENVKVKLKFDDIYIEYSDVLYLALGNLKLKGSVSDLTSLINMFLPLNDTSLDVNKIISDLNNATVVKNADGNLINVKANLDLMGISLPLEFNFSYNDDTYGLLEANTSLNIEGIDISLKLTPSNESIADVDKTDFDEISNLDYIFENIYQIITNKKLQVIFDTTLNDFELSGYANIDFSKSILADINLNIAYQNKYKALNIKYINDNIYLQLDNIKLKISTNDLMNMLSKYLDVNIFMIDLNTSSIINIILSIDYDKLIKDFEAVENNTNLTLNFEQFMLGLNEIKIAITNDGNLNIDTMIDNLSLNLELADFDGIINVKDEEYENLSYLQFLIDDILTIINTKSLTLEFNGNYQNIKVIGLAKVDFSNQLKANISLNLMYKEISLDLNLAYFDNYTLNNLELNQVLFIKLNNIYGYIQIDKLYEIVGISNVSGFNLDSIITLVLSTDFSNILANLKLVDTEISADILLNNFIADLNKISIAIKDKENGFNVLFSDLFNLSLNIYEGYDGEISLDESNNYYDLSLLIDDIMYLASLIGKSSFNIDVDASINLSINNTIYPVKISLPISFVLGDNGYDILINVEANVMDNNIYSTIKIVDNYIYLSFFKQTFKIEIQAIDTIIQSVMPSFNSGSLQMDLSNINTLLNTIKLNSSSSIEIDLSSVIPSLAIISISMSLAQSGLEVEVNNDLFTLKANIYKTDLKEITIDSNNIIYISAQDVENFIEILNSTIYNFSNSKSFNIDIDLSYDQINIVGNALITKDLNISLNLMVKVEEENLNLQLTYLDNKLYVNFNNLKLVFNQNDLNTIISTITELISNVGLSIDNSVSINEIISSLLININEVKFNNNQFSLDAIFNIMGIENINLKLNMSRESINISGNVNSFIINNLELTYGNEDVILLDTNYLPVENIVSLFENLENGISSEGLLTVDALGYQILLPYNMQFKLDLIELLKGENAFKAIELKLDITSEYYDPITLTILDGVIYLDSMNTKYKYIIPQYHINLNSTTINDSNINSSLISSIISIINNIKFNTNTDCLSVTLSDELLAILGDSLTNLIGNDLSINEFSFTVNNLTNESANFNLAIDLAMLGIDIGASLEAKTIISSYCVSMTQEEKDSYILTENFLEHPFAIRVLDVLEIIKGFTSMDFASGQNFSINIPLQIESSLIKTVNVSGNLGIYFDLQSILNGNNIWESFNLSADIKIEAKTNLLITVNIYIEVFYVGDGYLYVIVNGDAAGISFSITESLVDLKDMLSSSQGDSSQPSIIYLNDLLNRIISGFTTNNDNNSITITLGSQAVDTVNGLWRKLVDLVYEEINSLNNSTVTSLIDSIVNFNMDISDVEIIYTKNDDGSFNNLKIILSGYRHQTFNPTELVITISHTGLLDDNYFDSYKDKANQEKYTIAKEEIKTAKEMVNSISEFQFTEEYYNLLIETQAYLDGMSEIAKNSYSTTKVAEFIELYDYYKNSYDSIVANVEKYIAAGIEGISREEILNAYDAYVYFDDNKILSEETLKSYYEIYMLIVVEDLKPLADQIDSFTELDEYDFTNNLDAINMYKNDLDNLITKINSLSESYLQAFMLIYSEQYSKYNLVVTNYTNAINNYLNDTINNYINECNGLDLQQAEDLYVKLNLDKLLNLTIDGFDYNVVYDDLSDFIYNSYVISLDKNIGKIIEHGANIDLVVEIPNIIQQYNQFSDNFKAYFKSDITALDSLLQQSKAKYVSTTKDLINSFNVNQETVNYGAFNLQKAYYYDYSKLTFEADKLEVGKLIYKYFPYASEEDIKSWYSDDDAFTKFRILYYCFDFILAVNDDTVSKDILTQKYNNLGNIESNYYITKYTSGIWGSKKVHDLSHSYQEIIQAQTSGLLYDSYIKYQNKI